MSFKWKTNTLITNLADFDVKTKAAVGLYGDTVAKKLEASAKANRPWTDRSGRARQSLNGDSEWVGNKVRVSLAHGVAYGIWLELCNEGKYSIIMPTINKEAPAVMEGLKKILK